MFRSVITRLSLNLHERVAAKLKWRRPRRRWNVCEAIQKRLECGNTIVKCRDFGLPEGNLLPHSQQILLALEKKCSRRLLRQVERALRTSHPVGTLIKEIVCAISGTQIVILPRCVVGESPANGFLVDKHLNRAKVAFKIPSGIVGFHKLC